MAAEYGGGGGVEGRGGGGGDGGKEGGGYEGGLHMKNTCTTLQA